MSLKLVGNITLPVGIDVNTVTWLALHDYYMNTDMGRLIGSNSLASISEMMMYSSRDKIWQRAEMIVMWQR